MVTVCFMLNAVGSVEEKHNSSRIRCLADEFRILPYNETANLSMRDEETDTIL